MTLHISNYSTLIHEGISPVRAPKCVHFGGPDRPPRALRDLLEQRVNAVPPGGEIIWATYYFRDEALASALIAASDRGVKVRLHMDGHPRTPQVNEAVLKKLQAHGLHGGLHVHAPAVPALSSVHPHLHSKIYYFSAPEPVVLVGSFNPSGNDPEQPEIIAKIGDQDRGHNMLVELDEPSLVHALKEHVHNMRRPWARFRPAQNRPVASAQAHAWFYPRLRPAVVDRHLGALEDGARIFGAISHLKSGVFVKCLFEAARKGAAVRLLVHDTERRVPQATVDALSDAGIAITRYRHPEGLPLHAKFLLVDEGGERTSYFGSFNYNPRSRFLNREILLANRSTCLFDSLSERFDLIKEEAETF